jgi:hypothetical protein
MKRKRILLFILGIIILFSILAASLLLQPAENVLKSAIARATGFLKERQEPDGLLMLNVMYRRFGISAFSDALQRYDQFMIEHPESASLMRVFRRIADHDNQLQADDLEAVWQDLDRLTVPALYCDRMGLPEDYPAKLEEAVNLGGYMLTHALLAWIWIQDNGCEVKLPSGFISHLYSSNAALIDDDSVIDDLELEAAAFLCLAGQGQLIDHAFVERVVAVQNYDGGWLISSDAPGESDWHTTIVGLLLLLHVEYQAASYPPMLASEPP